MTPAAADHFRLHVLATVAHLIQEAARGYDSPEALIAEIPFLRDYLDELEQHPDQTDPSGWHESISRLEGTIDATIGATRPAHLPLRALRDACGLDRISMGVLVTAGLIEEDPRFGLLFEPFQRTSGAPRPTAGVLNAWWRRPDDRGEVRNAIRRLRELGLVEVVNPDAPRLDWALQVPGAVWDAIRGDTPSQPIPGIAYRACDALTGAGALIFPDAVAAVVVRLATLLRDGRGGPALIVRGAAHAGRGALVDATAASLGLGIVEVAASLKLDDARWSQLGAVATMLDALLLVRADGAAGEQLELRRPAALTRPLAVIAPPSLGVTVSGDGGAFYVELPLPDLAERAAHWARAAPASQHTAPRLAERFRLGRGQIHRAAAIARARAELDGRAELGLEDVRVAIRSLGASTLESLAPRVLGGEPWDRFVVAPDTLDELRILERRCRHRERLNTPGARPEVGVRALFKGPSGTGKTMAARVLATALAKDLYRVDLAAAVSKYIGETEKNLGRIFALGEELDAMLLFDEGDALFGARTSVQSSNDRYANLETNYLLQRIETFDGILIITTNAADAIDGAFQRRMDVVVDFRPPEASERLLLWQVHLPADHAVPPLLLRELAARCTFTGAQVRNIMLHASLLALDDERPVDGAHVEAAVLREYRKIGAILSAPPPGHRRGCEELAVAGVARLFPASPKPAGGPVTPAVRAPRVRFARAGADKRFVKVMAQLQQSARRVGQRPPAKRKADEAQAAAQAPANEKVAGGRANQVDDMKDAKVEKPGTGGFLAILRAEIEKVMPKNLDQADKFMKGGESEQVKGSVGKNVSDQKQKAAGPTEQATAAPPDTGKVEGKEVTALPAEPAPAPPPVAGAEAMPAPKPQAEVAKPAADATASADQKLKDAELTEPQLKKANDPRFSSVLSSRDKAKETAAAGPAKYRAKETASLTQAKAGALGDARKGLGGLAATKHANIGKNKSRAQLAKEKDEAERKKVTDTIASIFDKTKTKVDQKLSTLETDAMAIFDAGADSALAKMKSSANSEIDRFKDDRYSGLRGKARWVSDLFGDTPREIKEIIARARERFTVEMDALAVRVAGLVDQRLADAKALVAAGQAEVKRYVAGLAPNLRAVGQQAQQDIQSKFDELKQSIDDKAQDLAEKLAEKYKGASEKADAAAKEMEEANKGALRALAEKVAEIARMLVEFAGRVVSLFKKAAGIVKKIIADPIGFLGNLLSAVKQGISRFIDNIWTHIKRGFMEWLFGALTKAGVEIPDGLPAPGAIVKLVLNVIGLTWANIRPKIVKKVGERAVAVLEKVVELLQKLFTGGVEALWAELQAFVGNIKAMVLDAILDWVITKVITKAIMKIASMFNPAGAIIQAIIMIYDVGTWLATNLPRILDFIESILNSVDRIANGDVGGAAGFIEQSLAKMIPILIGFLASLIGLGGVADKVKSLIKKVQAAVGKAVDLVIDKVFNAIKSLFKGKGGSDDEKQEKLRSALSAARAAFSRFGSKSVGKAVLKPILAAIKLRYGLKSLEAVQEGKVWVVVGVINPTGREPTDAKAASGADAPTLDDAKAKAAEGEKKAAEGATAAKELSDAEKKLSAGGSKAASGGIKHQAERRAALAKEDLLLLPSAPRGEGQGAGFDAPALSPKVKTEGQPDQLQLRELKKGTQLRVLKTRGSKRSAPSDVRDLGAESANVAVVRDPAVAEDLMAGTTLLQNAKVVENKLSSITTLLSSNMKDMIDRINAAIKSGELPPDTEQRLKDILAGAEGGVRVIIEIEEKTKISKAEGAAKDVLLEAAFKKLKAEYGKEKLAIAAEVSRLKKG